VLIAQYKLLASAARASAAERAACWLSSTEEGAKALRKLTTRINRRGRAGAAEAGGNRGVDGRDEDEDEGAGWEGSIQQNILNPEQRRDLKRNAKAQARSMLVEQRRAHYLKADPQQAGARKRGAKLVGMAFEYLVRVWTIKEGAKGQGRQHIEVGSCYHAIGRMVLATCSQQQGVGTGDSDAQAAQYLTIACSIYEKCAHLPMHTARGQGAVSGQGQEEGKEEGGGVSADDAPILATARAQLGELQLRRAKAKGKGKGVSRNYTEPPADLLEPIEAEAAVDAMKGAALYLTKLCVEREAVGGLYRADGAEGVLVAERAVRLWSQIAATHEQLAAQGAGGGRLYRTKPEDQQEHRAAAVEAYCSMVEAARAGYGAGSSTNAKASRQYGDACMRLGPAADIGWAASFAPAQQAYRAHLQASHVLCAHYGKHDPRHIHASARAKSAKRAMAKGARNQSGEMGAGSGGPSDGAEDALDLSGDLAFLD
jgi:hypothetical protein